MSVQILFTFNTSLHAYHRDDDLFLVFIQSDNK